MLTPYLADPETCACGCGELPRIVKKTSRRQGWIKGCRRRFVNGHNRRGRYELNYTIENRGHETPCWVWQGRPNAGGYGQISRDGRHYLAHRFFYVQAGADLPKGQPLDHLCGVRLCVNPGHLKPTTDAENIRRGARVKLTHEIAQYIRTSTETRVSLAQRFGISETHVYRIRRGDSWA